MSMENKKNLGCNIFNWIEENLDPIDCTSEDFIYNEMESQSGNSLPIIYQPFDGRKVSHWIDRGLLYDFLYSTEGENKNLLDFGPGDGWPSLIVAPYAKEVVGIDSSTRRIEVCSENAKRLGITNVKFKDYVVGSKIPFEDNSFDGVMAASSVEQTPNPKETLKELYRVLKPEGRLRIHYEALSRYKNGGERDLWIADLNEKSCKLILSNRNIEDEYVIQYGLTFAMSKEELMEGLSANEGVSFNQITIPILQGLKSKITKAQVLKTVHPSAKTIISWLKEIGFKEVIPSHSGSTVAFKLFNQYDNSERPKDLHSIDEVIKNVVKVAVQLKAPIEIDPMITAIK